MTGPIESRDQRVVFPGAQSKVDKLLSYDSDDAKQKALKGAENLDNLQVQIAAITEPYFKGLKKVANNLDEDARRRNIWERRGGRPEYEAMWIDTYADNALSLTLTSQLLFDQAVKGYSPAVVRSYQVDIQGGFEWGDSQLEIFCDPDGIRRLNLRYKSEPYYMEWITRHYEQKGKPWQIGYKSSLELFQNRYGRLGTGFMRENKNTVVTFNLTSSPFINLFFDNTQRGGWIKYSVSAAYQPEDDEFTFQIDSGHSAKLDDLPTVERELVMKDLAQPLSAPGFIALLRSVLLLVPAQQPEKS